MGLNFKIGIGVVIIALLAWAGLRLANYSDLKAEKKKLEQEVKKFDNKLLNINQAKLNDSLEFVNRVSEFQKTIALLSLNEKTAENNLKRCEYEKDKILRGELCEESYGFLKKKKRLVPCN